MYDMKVLRTAHIDCMNDILYQGGCRESATTIGCHAFLLKKSDTYYLIDTGIEDVGTANRTKSSKAEWTRGPGEYSVKQHLDILKIPCGRISRIFLTHSHYDHISGIVHFGNAEVYMTRAEYAQFRSDTNAFGEYLDEARKFLENRRLVLFERELVVDDIVLKQRGGHTEGSMSVEADGVLFVGDTIFVQDNLIKGIPAGFTQNAGRSRELMDLYSRYPGRVVTSHDAGEVL